MLKRIGAEQSGEFKAVASGTLPSGKPVIVNADGTVSLPVSVTGGNGTPNTFSGGNNANHNGMSEVGNSKFVIAYRDSGNSNRGTAVVATGSGTTLSYGTPVQFDTQDCREHVVVYDSNADRVVIFYYGAGDDKGYAIVGTVSGTSISFGTRVEIEPTEIGDGSGVFDPINNKVVFFYKDVASNNNYGTYVIGTVSGSSVSFTTPVVWHSNTTRQCAAVYDTTNSKMVVAYRDVGASSHGKMIVADPGASSLTLGSEQTFASATSYPHELVDDTVNGKLIIFYAQASQSGAARVITVDGANKTISAGSELVYESGSTDTTGSAAYNTLAGKAQSMCKDQGDSNKAKLYLFTVSGTTITLDSTTVIDTNGCDRFAGDFSPSLGASVFVYTDEGASQGEAFVTKLGYNTLTSENYIGMSRGVNFQSGSAASLGSATTFESATVSNIASGYDTSNDKVVIFYRDHGNSDYGTAVVGTVSGSSISFGTPVVFNSDLTQAMVTAFDSSNNKMPVFFSDSNNYGKFRVGTVSGTSISFGSKDVFSALNTRNISVTFDTSVNKFLVVYRRAGNYSYGGARVGTVSGTNMTFGTEVNFNEAQTHRIRSTFDSSNNKHVVVYYDGGNSDHGTAIVGTISGTNVSFGSEVVFNAATTNQTNCVFDSSNNKVVVTYYDGGNSDYGTAIVGTVSGTSFSFGSEVVFHAADTALTSLTFDSNANKIALFYTDGSDSNKGKVVTGTVSGTSISFSSELTVIDDNGGSYINAVFDPDTNQSVVSFRNSTSSVGQSRLYTSDTVTTTQGQVTNGQAASVDVIGSVSDNQIGLTAGQQYFVQTDGTISTTAGSPSVLAGTAISATELVVKT